MDAKTTAELGAVDETSSTGGTPVPPVEERAPDVTAAGRIALDGAESQAAAGVVYELQVVREKINTVRTDLDLLKVSVDNLRELLGEQTSAMAVVEALGERIGAIEAAIGGEATLEECSVEIADRPINPSVRQCLELMAAQVESLGADRTVNLVRNTLDGVAESGGGGGVGGVGGVGGGG